MKKLCLFLFALPCVLLSSCWHHDKDISFAYSDTYRSYSMDAWFSRSETRRAERYMNETFGQQHHISFYRSETEETFRLDDGSKFYMKKSPGHILIKINKDEASDNEYYSIKAMCIGMKDVVLNKQ